MGGRACGDRNGNRLLMGTGLPPWPREPCWGPADVALRVSPGANVPPQRREALREGVEGRGGGHGQSGDPRLCQHPPCPRGLELRPLPREAHAGPGPALARLVPAEVISRVPKPLRSAEWVTQPAVDGSHPVAG